MRGTFNPARPWDDAEGIPLGSIVYTNSANPNPDLYVQPSGQVIKQSDYSTFFDTGVKTSPYGQSSVISGLVSANYRRVRETGRTAGEHISLGANGRYNYSTDSGVTWSTLCEPPTQSQIRAVVGKVFGGDIYAADMIWDSVAANYILFISIVAWNADNTYQVGMQQWKTATLGGAWTHVRWYGSFANNQVNTNTNLGMRVLRMSDGSTVVCDGYSKIYKFTSGSNLGLSSGGPSNVTTMIYIDSSQASTLFLNISDSGELLIYNQNKATYRTSADLGSTWTNRTCPSPIQSVQYGPAGWWLVGSAYSVGRMTTDHTTFTTPPAITLQDEFAGKTISALFLYTITNKITPDAPSLYVTRCLFSDYLPAQYWIMFSYDMVNWSLEPIQDSSTTFVLSWGKDRLFAVLNGSTVTQLPYGPFYTLPTLPSSYRGKSPFMKLK